MSVNSYHKKKKHKKTTLELLVNFAIVFGPAMTIPQVYDIWILSKKDVSTLSWVAYLLTSIIWLFYGLKQKDKPIIVVQALWVVLSVMIIVGLYK